MSDELKTATTKSFEQSAEVKRPGRTRSPFIEGETIENEFVLKISDRFKNRQVFHFNDFSANLVHDSIASGCSFQFLFDPNNEAHKELACFSHYHEFTLAYKQELLITGYLMNQATACGPIKEMASFSGSARPIFLEDCEIPPDLYPLQSSGLSLKNIAERLIKPFKLQMSIDPSCEADMSKSFDTSSASDSQTVKAYLHDLAKQKDIVMSHNEKGHLLFTKSKTDQKPILDFDTTNGTIPGTSFRFEFDGQKMHSHIYIQGQADVAGGNAREAFIRNPYVPTVYRPTVKSQSSGDDNDSAKAARRELANELRGIRLTVKTDRWVVNGKIIRQNNIISVISPENYIYKKTNFFIESVSLRGNHQEVTAELNCVLPEVYSGEVPTTTIFEGINMTPKPHI